MAVNRNKCGFARLNVFVRSCNMSDLDGGKKTINSILKPGIVVSLAITLGACASSGNRINNASDPINTASIGQGSIKSTYAAREAWLADRKDLRKGMAYVRQLQALGQTKEQLSVLEQMIKTYPNNTKLLVFYGKLLIKAGQSRQAVDILKQAERRGERDWRLYSALGSALDQTGRNNEARTYYQKALKLNPTEVKIQNNLAMSYTLEGKFSNAEQILRKANDTPSGRAMPRIRQNLALVVGLQGRFEEARQIASRDLPQEQVDANMAFLQKMLAKDNTWSKLKKG